MQRVLGAQGPHIWCQCQGGIVCWLRQCDLRRLACMLFLMCPEEKTARYTQGGSGEVNTDLSTLASSWYACNFSVAFSDCSFSLTASVDDARDFAPNTQDMRLLVEGSSSRHDHPADRCKRVCNARLSVVASLPKSLLMLLAA